MGALGIINFSEILSTWWPALIILAGITILLTSTSNKIVPVLIIILGILLQIDSLKLVDLNLYQMFWPLVLIAIGFSVLFHKSAQPKATQAGLKEDKSNLFAILSSIESKVTASAYNGGHATALLGGITIDLRNADIKDISELNLTAIMGGIDVLVPKTWAINVSGTPLLGGWENTASKPTKSNAPTLNINATCIMGGIEIKN